MASSSHSAVAPRQKAAELVSPKGICVVAHFVQCFSILPNRFLLKGYRCCSGQAMALGPYRGGGRGQALSHPTQYSPSFLTSFKPPGLSFGERGRGRERALEVVPKAGLLKLRHADGWRVMHLRGTWTPRRVTRGFQGFFKNLLEQKKKASRSYKVHKFKYVKYKLIYFL